MKNIHPGVILKMELIENKKLTVIKVAELLAIPPTAISNIFNGHSSISPNMALRLEKVFGGTARHFLNLQSNYDLLEAEKDFNENPPKIKHYNSL